MNPLSPLWSKNWLQAWAYVALMLGLLGGFVAGAHLIQG